MPSYVALLRAINVGGRNKIKMADLKSSLLELGLQSVHTYLQSGNVLFQTAERSAGKLRTSFENQIEETFGFHCHVLIRSIAEIKKIVDANPYRDPDEFPANRVGICFFDRKPKTNVLENGQPEDLYTFDQKQLYLFIPDGFGKTKWTNGFIEKKTLCKATTRNRNTLEYLANWEAE